MSFQDLRIETERLILRPPTLDDLDRWADMMADPVATRFLGGVQPKEMVWRGVMTMIGSWASIGVGMFSMLEKGSGKWLGRCGPWSPLGWPGTEVGWGLHPDAWGKGYAFEAARAGMDYAVDVLGWTDIIHSIHPDNEPSIKLAQRLGSKLIGPQQMPPPFTEEPSNRWGQSADGWMLQRRLAEN